MKDTLGHQSEEEKMLDDVLAAESRVRALDTVMQKLSIEIASAERRENHPLSDEEVDDVMRNIANPSIVSHNKIVTPGRSVEDMKKEYYNLLKEREDLKFNSMIGKMRSDFAAAKNPWPTVPTEATISVGSSGKNEEDDAHAINRKVLKLVGGVI